MRLTVATPPAAAAPLRTVLTGLVVHPATRRAHTTALGEALADAEDAASAPVQATREAAEPVDPAPGTLVVATDGALVRYVDGWHEGTIGVVGGTADGEVTAPSDVAARASAAQVGPRLLAEAARRGAVAVVAEHFGEWTEAVDCSHAAEHVGTVARAVYGAASDAARVGATVAVRTLRASGGAPVRAARPALHPDTAAAAAVVRTARGYFATNAARRDDPTLAAQGLPIGSGAVESRAAQLVQHRMKRLGQRWSARGARAMLTLRARAASGRPFTRAA